MTSFRFILFAHPRSGSTTLANLLNLHPCLNILVEPFHENFHLWSPKNPNYLEQVVDTASLDSQLARIFETHNGIKTINWPLPFELYAHMLSDEQKRIIFLRRRNMLRAGMSNAISHRIGVWKKQDLPSNADALYEGLGEIPVSRIIEWVEAVQEDMGRYEALLDSRPAGTVKKLTYETLYEADPLQEETLQELFDFLGVKDFRSDEMSGLWDKGRNQMNTEETYRSVQNHREIDETGSRMGYGFLFK